MKEQTNINTYGAFSRPNQDHNIIKVRLDTSKLIADIETYLRGTKEVIMEDQQGHLVVQTLTAGISKMNEIGIRSLLNWIAGTVNSQVVQGNFPYDRGNSGLSTAYQRYIYDYRIALTQHIIINCVDWELHDNEIEGLIDFIMLLIKPYMSRLIGNKERDSYSDTIKTVDSQQTTSRGGGLKLFK